MASKWVSCPKCGTKNDMEGQSCCPKCGTKIINGQYAAQQCLRTDAAIAPPVEADSQSDIIPAGEVDHQPRR